MDASGATKRSARSASPAALVPALLLLSVLWCGAGGHAAPAVPLRELDARRFTLVYPGDAKPEARKIGRLVNEEAGRVASFFGSPYPYRFTVRLFTDRASLTDYWRRAWGEPGLQPECWMVASGTASALALLSPSAWKREACEHDPDDAVATRRLIAHELVHVYHGQVNPDPEFDASEEIGWFVEGLAVLASGQLDGPRLDRARRALAEGKGPKRLAEAWSGPDRYGIAGSLVAWLEKTRGRAALLRMMRCRSNEEILAVAGCSEQDMIRSWRSWILSSPSP